jgi:hypothetical protein
MADDQRDAHPVVSYDYRAFGYRPSRHTMQSFAVDNGMEFTAETPDPGWAGLIFSEGTERRAEQRVHGENPGDGRGFDIGSVVYRVDDEPDLPPARWSYLRVALREPLPHLLLEPVEGNVELIGFDEALLPQEFSRDEPVAHPLDDVFVLYAPPTAAAAALAVLTPELMGLLVDDAEPFTVEIRGLDMVVFGPVGAGAGSAKSELPEHRMRRFLGILGQLGVAAGTPGAADPSHPEPDEAFYDPDVVDPQTRRFSSRVVSLGVVVAVALLLGAINLIWPDSIGDFVRELQSGP